MLPVTQAGSGNKARISRIRPRANLVAIAMGAGLFSGAANAEELVCVVNPEGSPRGSEICDLGAPPADSTVDPINTTARGISADGSVIVGNWGTLRYLSALVSGRGFIWSSPAGPADLQSLSNAQQLPDKFAAASITGVSGDGRTVIGAANEEGGGLYSFRWTARDGFQPLTDWTNYSTYMIPRAANFDGTVIVGLSNSTDDIFDPVQAFRWVEGRGVTILGALQPNHHSEAHGVSRDGSVVVGLSAANFTGVFARETRAFRWVEGQGMRDLGAVDGRAFAAAYAVNADGSVVVGDSWNLVEDEFGSTTTVNGVAFRWIDGRGMESLGLLPGFEGTSARAVSANGSVVVGTAYTFTEVGTSLGFRLFERTMAFRWVEGQGMHALGSLTGLPYSEAVGVSADGTIVIGTSSDSDEFDITGDIPSRRRAFIWRSGRIEDYNNLLNSFPVLGVDSAVALTQQQMGLERLLNRSGVMAKGRTLAYLSTDMLHSGRSSELVGRRTSYLGAFNIRHGVTDHLTLGATIGLNGTDLSNNAFDMRTGRNFAVWGNYSAGGPSRTGLQLGLSAGFARAKGDVVRGRLLTDVVNASGKATVDTKAYEASLAYGFRHADQWVVTPRLPITHFNSRRSAYAESGASFNASYDAIEFDRTVAALSLQGSVKLGERDTMRITAGVEREINREAPRLSGTTDLPALATFDVQSTVLPTRTRPFAGVGMTHTFSERSSLSIDAQAGRATYGDKVQLGVGIGYALNF